MKVKKIFIILALVSVFIVNILLCSNVSYAQQASTPLYIGITELKLSNIGYGIGDPNSGGEKIWNLIQYQSQDSSTYSENNIYCLKAGAGFENVDKRAVYDIFYDMKTEKTAMQTQTQNTLLQELATKTLQLEDGTTISQYSAILALLDMCYFDKKIP